MSMIEINRETCTRCGLCADECPGHLIVFQKGNFPRPIDQIEILCAKCGHCVAVCPNGSLDHRDSPLGRSQQIDEKLIISVGQCEQFLKSRRSVRVFAEKPVGRDTINRLIEYARYAPTGHNAQEVEWLVIDDKKQLNHIEELGTDWIKWMINNQPEMSAFFNMEKMLERQIATQKVFLRGAPVLIVTHASSEGTMRATVSTNGATALGYLDMISSIDSATALAYLDLAANSSGLGTCWAGLVYDMANFFPPVKAALALPEKHATYGCVMLGYNKHRYHRIPVRKQPAISWK